MTRAQRQTSRRRGVSLVESVLAAALLGGALAATLNVVGQAGRRHALDTREAEALLYAQDAVVEYRKHVHNAADGEEDLARGWTRTTEVTYLDPATLDPAPLADGPTEVLLVTVTVYWSNSPIASMSTILLDPA